MDFPAKLQYITFAPCATAPLSILGSTLTLLTIYRTRLTAGVQLTTYHRLVMGTCITDLIFSMALALGPLPAPKAIQLYGFVGAHGTLQTCTAQGFFVLLGAASLGYTTMLMWYYVFVIVFNMKEKRILRIEPFLHVIPIAFYLVAAILGLVMKMINFSGAFCFLGAWPLGCVKNPNIPCQRGGNIRTFSLWTGTIPILVWNSLSVLALMIVGSSVLIQYRRNRRFEFPSSVVERRGNGQSGSAFTQRQVIVQCSLYAFQFINVAVWISISSVMEIMGDSYQALGKHFWIFALGITLFPLQGFFLFLIFMRPRYVNARTLNPDLSLWQCFRGSIWNPSICNARHVAAAKRSSTFPQQESRLFTLPASGEQGSGAGSSNKIEVAPETSGTKEVVKSHPDATNHAIESHPSEE